MTHLSRGLLTCLVNGTMLKEKENLNVENETVKEKEENSTQQQVLLITVGKTADNFKESINCKINENCKKNENDSSSCSSIIPTKCDNGYVKKRTINIMIASSIILCILHPLDTIRTRKQVYHVYKNIYPYFYNNKYSLLYILKNERIESIYRGIFTSVVTTAISHGIFRCIYDSLNYNVFHFKTEKKTEKKTEDNFQSKKNFFYEDYKKNVINTSQFQTLQLNEKNSKEKKNDAKNNNKEDSIDKYVSQKDVEDNEIGKRLKKFYRKHIAKDFSKAEKEDKGKEKKKENEKEKEKERKKEKHHRDTKQNINNLDEKQKNVNTYLLTSTLSSIISIIFVHPLWFIKTKIEGTINVKYKNDNYKTKLLRTHYTVYLINQKKRKFKFPLFSTFINLAKQKNTANTQKFKMSDKYNVPFKPFKNNFIYRKQYYFKKKHNFLFYKNEKNIYLNKSIRKKIMHNYSLYEYYTSANRKGKKMTKQKLSFALKKFCRRHILYSKNVLSNNTIYHIFKRGKRKNKSSTVYVYKNYFHFIYHIYKTEKISAFYKGFFASLLLTPHVTIQFYTYEYLSYYFKPENIKTIFEKHNLNIPQTIVNNFMPFVFGVLSKYIAIVFTYPLYTIKIRQQIQSQNWGFLYVLKDIFKFEGIKGYYTGITMHLLRNCLQNGMLFFVFEYLNHT